MVPKFFLLDQETIQSVIDAYAMVEEHYRKLLILGGRLQPHLTSGTERRVVWLPADKAPTIMKINASLSKAIQKAIANLDVYCRAA